MRFPRDVSAEQLINLLRVLGYTVTRQKGSHIWLTTELESWHAASTFQLSLIRANSWRFCWRIIKIMLNSLEEIVERLVEGYDPERIVLFGSRATGSSDEGSDFDLIVVKETDQRPMDRRMEVERLLADRSIPLDLNVFTPAEVWKLYVAGSPLIQEVAEKGKVLYVRNLTQAWFLDAREHLESAELLYENGKYRPACYHSQQCVEKILKALILEKGRKPARTHDVLDLLDGARREGWAVEFSTDDAVLLNSVYRGRYPSEEGLLAGGEPLESDAGAALKAAKSFFDRASQLLK